jgi:biopolymer transport protein ExbD
MFQSMQSKQKNNTAVLAIDVAPLIDIIFILLIFFMVSTTFIRETGIEISRPRASDTHTLEGAPLRVSIAASGALYCEGKILDLEQLQGRVESFAERNPAEGVVIIPDESVSAGRLVAVMDITRLAGKKDITIATRKEQ